MDVPSLEVPSDPKRYAGSTGDHAQAHAADERTQFVFRVKVAVRVAVLAVLGRRVDRRLVRGAEGRQSRKEVAGVGSGEDDVTAGSGQLSQSR